MPFTLEEYAIGFNYIDLYQQREATLDVPAGN
jgi:hypothetical protein